MANQEMEKKIDQEINEKLDNILKTLSNLVLDIKKINKHGLIPPIRWGLLFVLSEIILATLTFYPTSTVFLNPVCIISMIAILIAFIIKIIFYFKK